MFLPPACTDASASKLLWGMSVLSLLVSVGFLLAGARTDFERIRAVVDAHLWAKNRFIELGLVDHPRCVQDFARPEELVGNPSHHLLERRWTGTSGSEAGAPEGAVGVE